MCGSARLGLYKPYYLWAFKTPQKLFKSFELVRRLLYYSGKSLPVESVVGGCSSNERGDYHTGRSMATEVLRGECDLSNLQQITPRSAGILACMPLYG